MEPDTGTGAHTLGPHVVGVRVVVRRLLRGETGPSGAPAMTDLLGTCEAWGDGVCVVQPESGEAVRIPLSDIVAGKPVPPRPSVRQRVSAREAEGHSLVMWPTVETEEIGDWVLRSDPQPVGRLLKRANSCLALGDPGVSPAEAAERVLAFYAARDREPMVQVEVGSGPEEWFSGAGWVQVPGGRTTFCVASLARALRACGGADEPALALHEDGPRAMVELRAEGTRVAEGRAAYDDDWLGVHAVQVAPEHRRRGLATAIVADLLDWGGARGATTAWLHVEHENPVARDFYDRLGFTPHHELRYFVRPA